jgi:hypothetical protein
MNLSASMRPTRHDHPTGHRMLPDPQRARAARISSEVRMIALHTRALCDECGAPAIIEDNLVFLCASCKSSSVTSGSPLDVKVSAPSSAPKPLAADTSFSTPMLPQAFPPSASANCGASASLLSFDDECDALEIEWMRLGIIMNETTLRVIAASDSISKSVSAGA